jgi:hypothetical protein
LGLELFIVAMWAMVLAVSAFLVLVVGPIEHIMGATSPRIAISMVQAAIALAAVLLLVFSLSRLKRAYANRKLTKA